MADDSVFEFEAGDDDLDSDEIEPGENKNSGESEDSNIDFAVDDQTKDDDASTL